MAENHDKLITNLVLIGVTYYFVVKPILEKTGITKDPERIEEDKAVAKAVKLSAWNPNFYKQYRLIPANLPISWLTDATVTAIAKKIKNAWGVFNDQEDAIYVAFRVLKSQLHLSQLADKYAVLYNEDLLNRLRNSYNKMNDGLQPAEFAIIAEIVNKLPVNVVIK